MYITKEFVSRPLPKKNVNDKIPALGEGIGVLLQYQALGIEIPSRNAVQLLCFQLDRICFPHILGKKLKKYFICSILIRDFYAHMKICKSRCLFFSPSPTASNLKKINNNFVINN